jgi:ferredoxin
MKVWIDQDLCTGDGLCVEICPDLFFMSDDGLAYVKDRGEKGNAASPRLKIATGQADVPDDILDITIEAAEECPGECIFIEVG